MPPHTSTSPTASIPLVSFQLSATKTTSSFPQLSPAEDTYLPVQYTARNVAQRKKNQQHLRNSLAITNDLPVAGIIVSAFTKKELKLLEQLVEAAQSLPVQLVLISNKTECKIAKTSMVKHLLTSEANVHLFFGAADIVIFPPHADDAMVAACFRYGLVPVVHNDQFLVRDYDPISEEGNAFTYQEPTIWSLYAALVRAVETQKLSYDWQRIERNGMDMT